MHGCSECSDFAVNASLAVQLSEHVQPIKTGASRCHPISTNNPPE
jgi:hypothetical protein